MSGASEDLGALLKLLAQETPEFEAGQRVLSGDDPFACVLHLIDQTVIPAVLEVSNGQGILLLAVAGRRLSHLPGVIDHLSADDADGVASATAKIREFTDAADGVLRVRERTPDAGGVDPAQSVSIKTLAAVADRPLIDAASSPVDQFRARLDGALIAGHLSDGTDVTETFGDAAAFENGLKELADMVGSGDAPHMVLFEVDDAKAPLRGAIQIAGTVMTFVVKGTTFAAILTAFHASNPG